MDPALDRRFPSVADIEKTALRRMPKFIADYIFCGMGDGGAVRRNRETLDGIKLLPRYLADADTVDITTNLFGKQYAAPFGIAPVGFGGFAWPYTVETLAPAARRHQVPFSGATFALSSLEQIRELAGDYGWLQFYRPNVPDVEQDLLKRANEAGYEILILTVDVPSPMRRDHDIRNGFSVPPQFDLSTVWELLSHPRWSWRTALYTLRNGYPTFHNMERYVAKGLNAQQRMKFMTDLVYGHITPPVMKQVRDKWPGTLIIKGVLHPDEATQYRDLGADAIIVSNHGGRQLEAAPSAADMLPGIRAAVGPEFPLIADGAIRTGLDICRMLALGADFVLMGRPFYYAVAAMGSEGADHVLELFKQELICVMGQLGCATLTDVHQRLIK